MLAPRWSKFAGLKLNAAPMAPVRERAPAAEPASHRPREQESELSRAAGQFAAPVEDARVMDRAKLPVLPHQLAAVEAGIGAILETGHGLVRSDVVDTLNARTALITPAAQGAAGRQVVIVAIEAARDQRLALERPIRERGREFGVTEGSRLDRVLQAQDLDRALRREIDIDHGPRRDRGLSLEM